MDIIAAETKFVKMVMDEMDSRGPVIEPNATRVELAQWFTLRGVDRIELETLLDNYEGFTITEMNEIYAEMCGDIA